VRLGERAAMNTREFGNFSQWPLKELIEKERSFTVPHRRSLRRNRSHVRWL
jgi:hypothetical protein